MHSIRKSRSDGFTLVEVLVALLVLSIGLLGIGKLVLFSSRANDSAYMRSQATALAYSILDSMRANRQTAMSGVGYAGAASAAGNPGVNCDQAAPCTSGTLLAQFDMWQWKNELTTALGPSADGTITTATVTNPVNGTSSVTATIAVQWDDTVAQQTFGAPAGIVVVTLETVL
ncbi:MAG TPA: type IV pilus modification protein PilV [Steroidobacteraceae bacterium]